MEQPPQHENKINSLADIEHMKLLDFINYLKREEATPSQKSIGNELDKQYWSKKGNTVTPGFLRTGINLLNIDGLEISRDDAKVILEKMNNNK